MKPQRQPAPRAQPQPRLNDDWKRWIAENLMLGAQPPALIPILLQAGVPNARAEIEAALRSPYLQGARRLHNRIAKRDWLLSIPARLERLGPAHIERKRCLDGDAFLHQHYRSNTPVILTGLLDNCPARTRWSPDYFQRQYGERMVEVQFGRNADPQYEQNSIAHKRQMRFGSYVALVRDGGHTNDFHMTANNGQHNGQALHALWQDVPPLSDYLAPQPDQRGFFWLGPAGTVTPLHHDLTNNFMLQIMGRKRVRLIAPWHTPSLRNHRHCFSEVDGRGTDLHRYPAMAGVPVLDCVLEPGEILFLPVGWWHFVEALDITVTISATHFKWHNDFYSNYPTDHDF